MLFTGLSGTFCVDGTDRKGTVVSENCFPEGGYGEMICHIRVSLEGMNDMNLCSRHFDELHSGETIHFSTDVMRRGFIHLVHIERQ